MARKRIGTCNELEGGLGFELDGRRVGLLAGGCNERLTSGLMWGAQVAALSQIVSLFLAPPPPPPTESRGS